MIKKILIALVGLVVVGVGVLFVLNGTDNYDKSKYSATVTNGLNIGSKINFTLPDQFDKAHSLNSNTKILILSFAKATGHTVKGFLGEKPKNYLENRDAFFIADISPMPTVIRNTFALPDLKKSDYSVLLIYDKTIASQIKNVEKTDEIAIVRLENGIIIDIKYILTEEELSKELN